MADYNFKDMRLEKLVSLFNNNTFVRENEACLGDVVCGIVGFGRTGIRYLSDALDSDSDIHRRWALFGISHSTDINRKKLIKLMLASLDDKCPSVISEAIDGLIRLGERAGWPTIMRLSAHPSEYVRGAVLRYANHALGREEAFVYLIEGLKDPHFIVIENAIDELDDLGKTEAVPYIEKYLGHSHPDVRLAAKTALDNLREE